MEEASGGRHVPQRLQLQIDADFRQDYLRMLEHTEQAGINTSDLLRALVQLANENPPVLLGPERDQRQERLRGEAHRRALQSAARRRAMTNAARSRTLKKQPRGSDTR